MTTGRLDFLFPDSVAQNISETYDRLALKAESHFAPRWEALPRASIESDAFEEIVQEITLHWMYFYAVNHRPPQMDVAEWEHPQTRRIIQSAVKRALQPGSDMETQLCANLMGLSEADYLRWRKTDDEFLGML